MSSHPPHTCLLVVDAQQQFANAHTAHVFSSIQAVLTQYAFVIASQIIPDPTGPIARWKQWQPAALSSPASALAIDLGQRPSESTLLVTKSDFNALTPTAITWLKTHAVTDVHLCGMDTDLCVARTAFAIIEAGFRPILLSHLCASTAGAPLHAHGLLQLKRMIGKAQFI